MLSCIFQRRQAKDVAFAAVTSGRVHTLPVRRHCIAVSFRAYFYGKSNMTITRPLMLWIASAVILAGCGAGTESARPPPPVEDTVVGDMVGTMDKARGVEATTMQHKEELDRSLQEAEGH
jgi:hypothetical protein